MYNISIYNYFNAYYCSNLFLFDRSQCINIYIVSVTKVVALYLSLQSQKIVLNAD